MVLGAAALPAAAAGASVTVAGVGGVAQANADGPTTLKLTGSGFQSIQGGFGGIYVLFGSVSGNWRPSAGGVGGRDFLYVPDVQAKDNAGREKFVAFPGSETAASANGGVIAADGSWSTTIEVPGAVFEVEDASGQTQRVDCREVQCGVITIGAHAVVNANNETFTPVSFGGAAAGGTTSSADAGATGAEAADAATNANAAAPPAAAGVPTLGVDATTAVAGHALAFTARGFAPGEQVTAVLDDGEVSVGPLTAGQFGEVASTIPLAADLRVGSHTLKITGAASGTAAEAMLTVRRDPSLVEASEQAADNSAEIGHARTLTPWQIGIVIAAIVFVLVLVGSLAAAAATRRSRARRSRQSQAGSSVNEARLAHAAPWPAAAGGEPWGRVAPGSALDEAGPPHAATGIATAGGEPWGRVPTGSASGEAGPPQTGTAPGRPPAPHRPSSIGDGPTEPLPALAAGTGEPLTAFATAAEALPQSAPPAPAWVEAAPAAGEAP
jgi:hypothetical protein